MTTTRVGGDRDAVNAARGQAGEPDLRRAPRGPGSAGADRAGPPVPRAQGRGDAAPRRQIAARRRARGRPAGHRQGAGRRRSVLAAPAAPRDRRVPDLRQAPPAGAGAPAGAHRRAPHRRDGTTGRHHPGQGPLSPGPHRPGGPRRGRAGRPTAWLAPAARRVPAGVPLPRPHRPLPRRGVLHRARPAGAGTAARPVRATMPAQPRRPVTRQHAPAGQRRVGAARLGVHRPVPARVRSGDAQRAAGRHARSR